MTSPSTPPITLAVCAKAIGSPVTKWTTRPRPVAARGRFEAAAHRLGGGFGAVHQRHAGARHALKDLSQQRVVGASQNQRVDFRTAAQVVAHQDLGLGRIRQPFLHHVHQHGAGLRPHAQTARLQPPLIGLAADGRLGADHADAGGAGDACRGFHAWVDYAPNRDGAARRQCGHRHGGSRVACHHQGLHALAAQEFRDSRGEIDHHFRRFAAVGHARRVTQINEIAVRHAAPKGLQNGEPADARIEHADRVTKRILKSHLFSSLHVRRRSLSGLVGQTIGFCRLSTCRRSSRLTDHKKRWSVPPTRDAYSSHADCHLRLQDSVRLRGKACRLHIPGGRQTRAVR